MDTTRCTITSDYHSLTREAIVKLLEQRDAELEQRDAELEQRDAELKNYYCPLNFWLRYKFRADTSHEVSALFVIFAFVPKLR